MYINLFITRVSSTLLSYFIFINFKKMNLQYTKGKLPPNFLMLGVTLALLCVVGTYNNEPLSLTLLLIAIPLIFIRTGIIIDCENKRLKNYIGLFFFKLGKWESIEQIQQVEILRVKQSRNMSVLSISRTENNIIYKMLAVMPKQKIELLSGSNLFIEKEATKIAIQLHVKCTFSFSRENCKN